MSKKRKQWSYENYVYDMMMEEYALLEKKNFKISGNDSLDIQVDRKLSSFESAAVEVLKEQVRSMGLSFLFEADEDDEEEELEEEPEVPEQLKTEEDIDVRVFASNVSSMIENVENILEFKKTLVRRSVNYLAKNYDMSVVRAYLTVLEDEFGLSIDKTDADLEHEDEAPRADRAGPLST
jgi:hypothetical protein